MIAIIVVIMVVAVVIVPFEALESLHPLHQTSTQPPPSSIHLGMLNISQVTNATDESIKESNASTSSFFLQSSQVPINKTIAYFNSTSDYGCHILIGSLEFSSNATALLFVTQIYETEMNQMEGYVGSGLNVTNDSFNGFHFTVISLGFYGSDVLITIGFDANFAFAIYSVHGPVTDPNLLIQDEISTMTG